jgi:hypothetical protein
MAGVTLKKSVMKRIYQSVIMLLVLTTALMSCKDDSVSPEKKATNSLNGTWVTTGGYVKVSGTDVTNDYSNFSISFSTTNTGEHVYTVANGGHAFAGITADVWSFDGSGFTALRRSDDVVMSYTIADKFLTLTFTLSDPVIEDGRVSGLYGAFEMKLAKK